MLEEHQNYVNSAVFAELAMIACLEISALRATIICSACLIQALTLLYPAVFPISAVCVLLPLSVAIPALIVILLQIQSILNASNRLHLQVSAYQPHFIRLRIRLRKVLLSHHLLLLLFFPQSVHLENLYRPNRPSSQQP